MRYVLSVLTHGDNAELLDGLVHSFSANVSPAPTACVVVQDGPCALPPMASLNWQCTQLSPQGGFCEATAEMWSQSIRVADETRSDYVFWLEHDFVFTKRVHLHDLALVLDREKQLAQIALMRGPVNNRERQLGGVVQDHVDRGSAFESHLTPGSKGAVAWISHTSYFTTNPSLMTVQFMVDNPWPDYESECEGKFAFDLRADGYRFGIMGGGEPWVEHVGSRNGFGY